MRNTAVISSLDRARDAHSRIRDQERQTTARGVSRGTSSSISAPINVIQVDGLKIAHKVIANGRPIICLAPFRGTLNDWDPAFVDAIAKSYQHGRPSI
jgi:hypothetical protein